MRPTKKLHFCFVFPDIFGAIRCVAFWTWPRWWFEIPVNHKVIVCSIFSFTFSCGVREIMLHETESLQSMLEADSPAFLRQVPENVDQEFVNGLELSGSIVGQYCHQPTVDLLRESQDYHFIVELNHTNVEAAVN
jgi:hypothetical protein